MGGGYGASANTRGGSLGATSVNSLLNLVILRQVSEARMPHLTNNESDAWVKSFAQDYMSKW